MSDFPISREAVLAAADAAGLPLRTAEDVLVAALPVLLADLSDEDIAAIRRGEDLR
jgi:hypothetical protein